MSLSLSTLGLGITMQRSGFSVSNLFGAGEKGTWYDPSDISTLFQDAAGSTPVTADNDPVRRMEDRSGNGNHAISPSDAKRPIYKTAGGLSWLEFDGVDASMETGAIDFSANDKMSVFSGVGATTNSGTSILYELSANLNLNTGAFFVTTPEASNTFALTSKGTLNTGVLGGVLTVPAEYVVSGLCDISGDSVKIRVDGVQKSENTGDQGTGNYGNYPLYIGMRAGTSLPFNGKVYGLITRGAASSSYEIASTESYLADKSGVTL